MSNITSTERDARTPLIVERLLNTFGAAIYSDKMGGLFRVSVHIRHQNWEEPYLGSGSTFTDAIYDVYGKIGADIGEQE